MRYSFVSFVAAVSFLTNMAPVCGQQPIVLKHEGWVAAVAFSPDGKTLASAGADNVVRLWEVGTWKAKKVLKGHRDCVCAVVFHPQEDTQLTGSYDHTVRFHDWTGKDGVTYYEHKGVVLCIAFDDYGAWRASGSVDGTIEMRSDSSGKDARKPVRHVLQAHKSWVNQVAFSIDRKVFASCSSDATVCLWDFSRRNERTIAPTKLVALEGGAGEVRTIAFTPDGKLLAAGNRYGTVRIWDVATRKEVKTLTGHMGEVWAIAFSPNGATLAAVDTEWKKPSKIKLYDTTTWQERGALPMPGEILCLAYSPNGEWLAAGSWDRTVRVFPVGKKS